MNQTSKRRKPKKKEKKGRKNGKMRTTRDKKEERGRERKEIMKETKKWMMDNTINEKQEKEMRNQGKSMSRRRPNKFNRNESAATCHT